MERKLNTKNCVLQKIGLTARHEVSFGALNLRYLPRECGGADGRIDGGTEHCIVFKNLQAEVHRVVYTTGSQYNVHSSVLRSDAGFGHRP